MTTKKGEAFAPSDVIIASAALSGPAVPSEDAAATAAEGERMTAMAAAAYARLNDVRGLELPNGRFCWLRGSELGAAQLRGPCVRAQEPSPCQVC